jgi:hypothetical protein
MVPVNVVDRYPHRYHQHHHQADNELEAQADPERPEFLK